ncbi:MAG TPA: 4Fe-4S dicluster domain-containing protein [Nitrospirota bacterium]|nr:4Fe-4S dicluster domain-containing protein [Nitrospirota bacterium]
MTRKYHRLRRITGAILLLALIGIPFVRVHEQSAFRFDIPTLRLLFFGAEIGMADFFIVLIALIFLTFFILFTTTLFGRIWCGWLCPQTVLVDVTDTAAGKRGPGARTAAAALALAVSGVVAASLIFYFVSPYDLPGMLTIGGTASHIITGSWIALTVLLFLDLTLLRRTFCATVCPYAKLQSVLFDDRTLIVAFDPNRSDECRECKACVRDCPVGIDIREGSQIECIHCAECVDACIGRMAIRGRRSLISYMFGVPGLRRTGLRINLLITGVISLVSLVFLVSLAVSRMPFDMNVRLNFAAGQQKQADGSVTNVYELSFRNLAGRDQFLALSVTAPGISAAITPSMVSLKKSSDVLRVPIVARVKGVPESVQNVVLAITATSSRDNRSMTRSVTFLMPQNPNPDKPAQNRKLKASLAEHAEDAEFKPKPESLSWRTIF